MTVQSTPRKSITKGAAVARRLAVTSVIAQHVLEATVEILDESRDVICKPGKYGTLFFVQSPKFPTRYYPVTCKDGAWRTTAKQNATTLIQRAQAYQSAV